MTAAQDDWDDFAVYPFRRQIVDEQTQSFPPPRVPYRAASPPPLPPARRPQRARANPLRLAVPVALLAFLGAVAGAATLSKADDVPNAIQPVLTPVAEAAAKPAARPHRAAVPHVFVPDVVGMKRKQAVHRLKLLHFRPHVKLVAGAPGLVLEQRPKPATALKKAGVVLVLVGRERPKPKPAAKPRPAPAPPATVIVTSVVGLPRDAATQALLSEGLGVRIYGVRSPRPAGTVVAQSPHSGSRARVATYVRINVAVH